jgi:hypothetical protein
LPSLASGQGDPLFQDLIATSPIKPSISESEKLEIFIEALHQREASNQKKFLKSIFKSTHQKFLKRYAQYSDLGEVFQTGNYDCLTATALFSIILSETDFSFRIIETNYHIFILVNTHEGEVLLETTDRFSGFVDRPEEIQLRIGSYKENKIIAADTDKTYYHYSFELFHEVTPNQLAGLLYFNQAIKAYNRNDLLTCALLLEHSKRNYESPRVEEFAKVLVKSILESNLSTEIKGRVILKYKNSILSKSSLVASR